MRTEKCNAQAVEVSGIPLPTKSGEFYWTERFGEEGIAGLNYVCPCGCGAIHGILFNPKKPPEQTGWSWDGNKEKPTCTPSLGLHPKDGQTRDGSGYHWHGYLRAGVFEEC